MNQLMKHKLTLLALLMALPVGAQVSNPSIIQTTTEPATCPVLPMYYIGTGNLLYAGNGSGTCQQVNTGGSGSGTVTSVSVTTANGVSGTVSTATTTPAISLTLGAITPTSVVPSTPIAHANIAATAVTPGSYTNANITVAADGSVTAVANGSGGGLTYTSPTVGYVPKVSSTSGSGTVINSGLDDGITTPNTLTYGGIGGIDAQSLTSLGSGGGFQYFTQGAAPGSPAGCGFSTTWCVYAPTSVVSAGEALPQVGASQGTKIASYQSGSSTTIQDSFSGDSNHALSLTSKTAALTLATLCSTTAGTACGQVGQYRVSYNLWGSGTACSSVTAGSVTLALTWTDENAVVHSAVSVPVFDQKSGAMGTSFGFNTTLATEGASGSYIISTNGNVIQYSTLYTACSTGTGTYNVRISVEPLQ